MNKKICMVIVLLLIIIVYLLFFRDGKIKNLTDSDINNTELLIVGNDTEYYFTGTYEERGAIAKLNNKDISYLIDISNNINNNVSGEYEVIYRIGNDNKSIEKKRKVILEDVNVEKVFDAKNNKVHLIINNNSYSYTILPNDIKETSNEFNYSYNDKGEYKFEIYLKNGSKKDYILNIDNLDMIAPSGTCKALAKGNNTYEVKVDATDESGIKKYQYNNQEYLNNVFEVSSENNKINIKIFDNNDNVTEITCQSGIDIGFKDVRSKSDKLGYAVCKTDTSKADQELEKIIQSYGEKTRSAVVAAALFLANYDYSISYQWGGKYLKKGLNPEWGCSKFTMEHNGRLVCTHTTGADTCEGGLDCTGFTSWAFIQAGFDKSIIRTSKQSEAMWGDFNAIKHRYAFNNNNQGFIDQIKPGDIIHRDGHVGMIIGVDDDKLQVAEMLGPIMVNEYSKTTGNSLGKQARFTDFVLFDDFYNMYGSNT